MIEKHFLFPEYYVLKVPKCDDCKIELQDTGYMIMTNPPVKQYRCSKCGRLYNFNESDIQGNWKFRTI